MHHPTHCPSLYMCVWFGGLACQWLLSDVTCDLLFPILVTGTTGGSSFARVQISRPIPIPMAVPAAKPAGIPIPLVAGCDWLAPAGSERQWGPVMFLSFLHISFFLLSSLCSPHSRSHTQLGKSWGFQLGDLGSPR